MNTPVQDQPVELIAVEALITRVQELRQRKARLVQISATRLPDQFELTYSFELGQVLTNLRVHLPATAPRVPSISPVYWCAFLYENELRELFGVAMVGIAVDLHGQLYQTAERIPFAPSAIRARIERARPPTPPKAAAPKPTGATP